MIPFGEWLPDLPALENPGATVASNVYPKTPGSYGPVSSLSSIATAMNARCQGAIAARSAAGTVSTFAGTSSKLYQIAGGTPTDVSKGGGYTTSTEESWEFIQFGERVIATNYADAVQSFTLGSSSVFANLSATAPKARHIAVIKDFVMLGNLSSGGTNYTNRVQWSAIDDATNWPTAGSTAAALVQSDFNDIPEGGWVQKIIGAVGGADGAIFMDTSIWRVQYEGPPTVLGFYQVERARGTPAPQSVVNIGPLAFYLGEDGFYVFNGSQSEPIGANKVDKTFFADLDQNYFHRIVGAADPINKLVIWCYPGSGNTAGTPNKLIIFNWSNQHWSTATVDSEMIFRSLTSGYTLDGLDATGYTLDTLPISLDSRVWAGGRLVLSGFDTSHRLATFTGSSLAATLETGELNGQGKRVFVKGIRPLVDGGTVTTAIKWRDTPSGSLTTSSASPVDADGVSHHRVSTRFARAQVNIAAAGSWTHAQGIEADMKPEGKR